MTYNFHTRLTALIDKAQTDYNEQINQHGGDVIVPSDEMEEVFVVSSENGIYPSYAFQLYTDFIINGVDGSYDGIEPTDDEIACYEMEVTAESKCILADYLCGTDYYEQYKGLKSEIEKFMSLVMHQTFDISLDDVEIYINGEWQYDCLTSFSEGALYARKRWLGEYISDEYDYEKCFGILEKAQIADAIAAEIDKAQRLVAALPADILTPVTTSEPSPLLERIRKTRALLRDNHHCVYDEDKFLVDTEDRTMSFDDNYYGEGSIFVQDVEFDIESIWTDDKTHDTPTLMIHVNIPGFEGDVEFRSLLIENQLRVLDILEQHIK